MLKKLLWLALVILISNPTTSNVDKIEANYEIIEDIRYHVLVDEFLENDDPANPDISRFTRVFLVYDPEVGYSTPHTYVVAIEKVDHIKAAKYYLTKEHPEVLIFEENTIVSKKVLLQWLKEDYEPILEYSEHGKMGLTYKELLEENSLN